MIMVDILVQEKDGSRGFYIPYLPERIRFAAGKSIVASCDILNRGTVEVPTGTELREVSWDGLFPGEDRIDTGLLRGERHTPSYYSVILRDWLEKGTVLRLAVFGYPINLDVILTEYTATPSGAFGDMEYSVTFREKRELTLWPILPETTSSSPDQSANPKRTGGGGGSYTIRSGDSLWKIAAQQLGNGTRYTEVYELNKAVLEADAQKYGRHCTLSTPWIYPGTVITLPQK